jgi:hypothetical protein
MEYDTTTSKFAEAVGNLHRRMGNITERRKYDRLERAGNEARVKSERARLALEQHIAEHGC